MAKPHPALLDLAAGRTPGDVGGGDVVASATEHGMQGLLWTWVSAAGVDLPGRHSLAAADLTVRHHHARLRSTLATVRARLSEIGVDVAAVKGVTTEARWYDRVGERPCSDVDILVDPRSRDRSRDVVVAIQPDHPLVTEIDDLVATRGMQAVTTQLDGIGVDIHFDLLKLGVPTRHTESVWDHTVPFTLDDATTVRVLDAEMALVHLLVHMNKDSFPSLLSFADIARVMRSPLDWDSIDEFVHREGIDILVYQSLATVTRALDLANPGRTVRGARARAWSAVWPETAILLGSTGVHRSRRQDVVPFLMRGRAADTLQWGWRTIFPPAATVAAKYGDGHGPYLWRLARGRTTTARARVAALRGRREPNSAAVRVMQRAVREEPRWMQAHGRSMGSSIPDGARVRVVPGDQPRRGEVWAFGNQDGNIVVHRCRGAVDRGYRFQGDVVVRDDGIITSEQLVGRVVEVGPGRPSWRWGPAAGAIQRIPRVAVATLVRAARAGRSSR